MKLKKILVVDDQAIICNLVKASLEDLWPTLKVLTCSNSREAFDQIKTFMPDLVLLDVQMGEVSGDDVAVQMKEDLTTKSIPIIFMTGILTPEEAHAKDGKIGGARFIAKPIDFKELIATIQKYFG